MPDLFGNEVYLGIVRSAEISDCGRYRYSLRRAWQQGGNGKTVCFLMLNPSTADAAVDDSTIRRCIRFVQAWGYSVLEVRNLFALRATYPSELLTAEDPIGPRGDLHLFAATATDLLVCAWGAKVPFGRDKTALAWLKDKSFYCLGLTKQGYPRHPLYAPGISQPILWAPGEAT